MRNECPNQRSFWCRTNSLMEVPVAQPKTRLLTASLRTLRHQSTRAIVSQISERVPSLADSCIDLIYHTTIRTNTTSKVRETLHNFQCLSLDSILVIVTKLRERAGWLKWLEREFTDRKVRGSNPTSASRLPLSRLGQPGSISALVFPSGGMAARHRKGVTAERNSESIRLWVCRGPLVWVCTRVSEAKPVGLLRSEHLTSASSGPPASAQSWVSLHVVSGDKLNNNGENRMLQVCRQL
ncbi:hypothetical protein CSKR_110671 [Clonorchis sinensis]|uniref:Uncharacterized protein n=1 Tax=Clonorchis sinensis TaxID=79923 RepID=A0A3R7H1I7_CLOSI|nr:hypothetical protein CSKR_110671 [Clonorchis sinensis]